MAKTETTETSEIIDYSDELRTLDMPSNEPVEARTFDSPELENPIQSFDDFQKPAVINHQQTDEAMTLIQRAIDSKSDPAILGPLMDLHERNLARIAKEQFNEAMAGFFSEMPSIKKNIEVGYDSKKGGRVSYKYCSLDFAMQKLAPILSKYGLFINWRVDQPDDGFIVVTGILCHRGGHEVSTQFKAPPDATGSKNPVQMIGSSISYGKRYTAFSLLGLAMGDDDTDGQTVDELGNFITPAQQQQITKRILEKNTTVEAVEAFLNKAFNIKSISEIPFKDFNNILKSLN